MGERVEPGAHFEGDPGPMLTAGVRIPWHRTAIDRDVLAELNRRRDLRPLVDNLAQLGFMAGTATLALHAFQHWNWPLIVLRTFLHTTFFGHYGSTAHHELRTRRCSRRAG